MQQKRKNIPLYLITGFLGSGKTSFLSNILEIGINKRIGIIQNEFGPGNFDGKELQRKAQTNFELLEINNGSVFCACLLTSFLRLFNKFIIDSNPEIVFLEASGLSDPVTIGEMFNKREVGGHAYLAKSICIIDAVNFIDLYHKDHIINRQLRIADDIIINKIDIAQDKDIESIISICKKINPFAVIHQTTHGIVHVKNILNIAEKPVGYSVGLKEGQKPTGRPDINSVVLRTKKKIGANRLEEFIKKLSEKSWRLKGYIELDNDEGVAIQSIFGTYSIEKVTLPIPQSEIIAIGNDFSPRELNNLYKLHGP